MEKLPLSIGILAWRSGQTLVNTLATYHSNGLFNLVDDIYILFQEFSETDKQIAEHFNIPYLPEKDNIGIGMGLLKLAQHAKTDNFLLLEHDWKLIENQNILYDRLKSGINLLDQDFSCIRYRHRKDPGHPHFSFKYQGRELEYYDDYYKMKSPHLLDSVHWCNPSEKFPEYIQKEGEYFTSTSRWGNWTNNPCLFKTQFYIDLVSKFIDTNNQITSEGEVAIYWAQQTYKVAHGEGLFKHIDEGKYGEFTK
tara:strand:+ start:487 stop:1242 length:756 start_codon:yes stop_codon:yes gene_type:complete